MPRLPISISIISMNEEANLRRCLASLGDIASEIVVVDSGSTDKTCEIAHEFGARVQHQKWLGHRDQKNIALGLCTQPWVLALDCDEELTPELHASIVKFFESGDCERFDGAWMNRLTWFLGSWIRHGDWYPDAKLRVFKREKSKWGGSPEHDYIELDGPTTKLVGDLRHYSFKDIVHYLHKHVHYSEVFLQRERDAGNSFSAFKAVARPFWRFFRAFVLRRGFLDGFPGFWIAISTAYFAFIRYSRRYEDHAPRQP